MNRRQFLITGAAATAAMMLDPERLLWVPGAKTFFIPDTTIVEAKTMEEALARGFIARVPSGHHDGGFFEMEVRVSSAAQFENEVAAIRRMGGYVVENRQYQRRRV